MKVQAIKQCDAWEPVSRGESPLAGKRALQVGQAYVLADGSRFSTVPEMHKDRKNRVPGPLIELEKAVKDGLVKRLKDDVA